MNTGSPAAPTEAALRTYLKEFLSDPRIIELPSWIWQPILRGIILRTRPAKSAQRYRKIWMPDGPPLIVYTQKIVEALNDRLPDDIVVAMAMKVGSPSVEQTVARLKKDGIDHFPFFIIESSCLISHFQKRLDLLFSHRLFLILRLHMQCFEHHLGRHGKQFDKR